MGLWLAITSLLLVGQAGVGKTALCSQLSSIVFSYGSDLFLVNLDAATSGVHVNVDVDIRDTVNYMAIHAVTDLGPNCSIYTCVSLFAMNLEDIYMSSGRYYSKLSRHILMDFPGQVELLT